MTVASRREREQQMRREVILDAARQLFKEKGFETTTVDEIANLAELGKGTIYSYFKGKDQIYVAILEKGLDILKERMDLAIQNPGSTMDALAKLYDIFIQFHSERRGFIEALFQQTSIGLGEVVQGLKNKSNEWTELVSRLLEWGIERGEIVPCEVEKVAKVIIGLILGIIIQAETGQIGEDLRDYRTTVFQVTLEGLIRR